MRRSISCNNRQDQNKNVHGPFGSKKFHNDISNAHMARGIPCRTHPEHSLAPRQQGGTCMHWDTAYEHIYKSDTLHTDWADVITQTNRIPVMTRAKLQPASSTQIIVIVVVSFTFQRRRSWHGNRWQSGCWGCSGCKTDWWYHPYCWHCARHWSDSRRWPNC